MCTSKWLESANFAIEGILHAAKTQRHVRYHFYSAVIVLLLSSLLGVSRMEFIALAIAVIMVLSAELLNTAIEAAIDLFSLDIHPKARIAKDVAAGAVLIVATGSAVVGYFILFPHLRRALTDGLPHIHQGRNEMAVISLIIVFILVILTKAFTGKGHPLKGGLPSGHAAAAFSIWVSVTYLVESVEASVLTGLLAVAISASRVRLGVHSVWEVVLGAFLGIVVTFLLFFGFT